MTKKEVRLIKRNAAYKIEKKLDSRFEEEAQNFIVIEAENKRRALLDKIREKLDIKKLKRKVVLDATEHATLDRPASVLIS